MNSIIRFCCLILVFVAFGCSQDFTPKPRGYPRIEFPEKNYAAFNAECPFTFSYPTFCKITLAEGNSNPCWFNIDYPFLRGRIHLSYKKIEDDLNKLLEDSRTLVFKHTVKASAIREHDVISTDRKVYAKVYNIDGNVASSIQFFATDSVHHFLRGALYFNAAADADSLQPAIDFVSEDIEELIESLNWR